MLRYLFVPLNIDGLVAPSLSEIRSWVVVSAFGASRCLHFGANSFCLGKRSFSPKDGTASKPLENHLTSLRRMDVGSLVGNIGLLTNTLYRIGFDLRALGCLVWLDGTFT